MDREIEEFFYERRVRTFRDLLKAKDNEGLQALLVKLRLATPYRLDETTIRRVRQLVALATHRPSREAMDAMLRGLLERISTPEDVFDHELDGELIAIARDREVMLSLPRGKAEADLREQCGIPALPPLPPPPPPKPIKFRDDPMTRNHWEFSQEP